MGKKSTLYLMFLGLVCEDSELCPQLQNFLYFQGNDNNHHLEEILTRQKNSDLMRGQTVRSAALFPSYCSLFGGLHGSHYSSY